MRLLSQTWAAIQGYLFDYIEDELGPITEKQKQLLSILELIRIENYVRLPFKEIGRKRKERIALARAFVAKAVYNLSTTRMLIDHLKSCPSLRRLCEFESVSRIPHESTFSRAFDEFTRSKLPQRVHEALIEKYQKDPLKGHISRDSSAIKGNEKPLKKAKDVKAPQPKRRRGRPKKGETPPPKEKTRIECQQSMTLEEMLDDLPKACDRGTKKNSKGYKESWNGYKLHLDSVDGQIPISCIVTSASVHDSQVAIPLSKMSSQRVTCLYELMDAAYDSKAIKEYVRSLDHVPIIDHNPRRGKKIKMESPTKVRYNERTSVERVFGRLKEEFGAKHVQVKGPEKVTAHLMFGIVALAADQLLRLVQ